MHPAAAAAGELVACFAQELQLRHAIINEVRQGNEAHADRDKLTKLHLSAWVLHVYIRDEQTSLLLGLNAARPGPKVP